MNKLQVVLGTIVLGAALVGCSNTDALQNQVDTLSAKVDALSNDVESLKAGQAKLANDVAVAKAEADRANESLDNMSVNYKK